MTQGMREDDTEELRDTATEIWLEWAYGALVIILLSAVLGLVVGFVVGVWGL